MLFPLFLPLSGAIIETPQIRYPVSQSLPQVSSHGFPRHALFALECGRLPGGGAAFVMPVAEECVNLVRGSKPYCSIIHCQELDSI